MKNYKKLEPEVIVGLGDHTEFLEKEAPFSTVVKLHIDLEDWLGDDLMECHPCYIVTESLKTDLENSEFTGFEFEDMRVTKAEYFDNNYQLDKSVPQFYWMKIIGKENEDDFFVDKYLMATSNITDFITKKYTTKYLDIDLKSDPVQQTLLEKLLKRAQERNAENSK